MLLAPVHDFRLSWREAPCSTQYAPSVLVRSVSESSLIRTSHPSGSRHWGCFCEKETPGPWLVRAPENPQYPGLSKWSRPVKTASQVCGSPPSAAASNPLWAQDRGVSVKLFAPRPVGGMRRRPNQVSWLSANPVASSPSQPVHLGAHANALFTSNGTWSRRM